MRKNRPSTSNTHHRYIPSLPSQVVSTVGEVIKLEGPIWRLQSNKEGLGESTISVGLLEMPKQRGMEQNIHAPTRASMFHPDYIYAIKVFLAESIPQVSPRGANTRSRAFHHFERYLFDRFNQSKEAQSFHFEDLTYEVLFAYTNFCIRHTAAKGAYANTLRKFYQWGVLNKITGFSKVTYQELRNIRMPGSLKGHITRFRDPVKGAFTWEEQVQIYEKLVNEEGDDEGRAIVSLYQQLGIRPEAIVLLRRVHLEIIHTNSGEEFFLNIPRVKKPGAVVALNDCARKPINNQLGRLLLKLHERYPSSLDAPLLPSLNETRPHMEIQRKMLQWVDEVDIVTARLPVENEGWRNKRLKKNRSPKYARLPVTAYRFRRTLATNLAEQGATVFEIAEALDDQSIGQATIYVENTSLITDVLESTIDSHPDWIQIIKLFRGQILSEMDIALPEILGGAPHLADYDEFKDIGCIGHCANPTDCHLEPPLSCYMCQYFRPALNSKSHERQLIQLQRELDKNTCVESDRMNSVLRKNMAAIVHLLSSLTPNQGQLAKVFNRIKATRTRQRLDHDENE
jgi:integrase